MQLKVDEMQRNKVRLKDMPEEWFTVPSDEKMKNSMLATIGVFACMRLMDEKKLKEADELMKHLLEIESEIAVVYRRMLTCERIYCEIISENRREVIDAMLTKGQKRFMRAMRTHPSVMRTQYAYEVLVEKNMKKAGRLYRNFEFKCRNKDEHQTQYELMQLIEDKILASRCNCD